MQYLTISNIIFWPLWLYIIAFWVIRYTKDVAWHFLKAPEGWKGRTARNTVILFILNAGGLALGLKLKESTPPLATIPVYLQLVANLIGVIEAILHKDYSPNKKEE
jgi:hypothetical protein